LIAQGSVPLPERSETFEYFPAQKGLLKTSSKLIPVAGLRNDIRIRRDFQVEPEAEAVLPGLVAGVLKVGAQSWERSSTEMAVVGSQTVAAIPGTRGGEIDFLTALPAAFLGGLLLNLMPCVFPVLWLKVLSFLQAAGRGRRRRLQDAMGYALGIVGSFLALAGVLLALRSGGQALGWGFQLQAPGFVLLVAALFFLISLNLLGVFEIGAEASGWLANRFSKSRAGRSTRSDPTDESFLSSMGTGVLAVIVATPCTAPFMGSALGFALTGPLVLGLLVFAALGLGLAFPYIILAVWPGLGRLLPRPGRWMETFKQALAFPMLATVAWLLWVLSLQRGSGGVLISLGVCLILALAAWGLRLQQRRPQARGRAVLGFLLVILLIVGGAANALQKMRAPAAKSPTESAESVKEGWLVWSPEAEALARRQGAVFIDFTAAWCVTCQVNEAAALDRPRVREAFRERGVRLMKADWTGEDPRITRALAAYGRTGVPLYVLIPFNGTPILLPQILSPAILLKELERIPRVN
jgi:thiol:disulfide interchange protein DsbD